jgi:hypothetical protein
VSNGNSNKEGDGDGNKGGGQVAAMATKRAMATVMRVAGNKEGDGNGGKSHSNGVVGGSKQQQ